MMLGIVAKALLGGCFLTQSNKAPLKMYKLMIYKIYLALKCKFMCFFTYLSSGKYMNNNKMLAVALVP